VPGDVNVVSLRRERPFPAATKLAPCRRANVSFRRRVHMLWGAGLPLPFPDFCNKVYNVAMHKARTW
jgi:hypothetical protein